MLAFYAFLRGLLRKFTVFVGGWVGVCLSLCVRTCVRVCFRACVRACVLACVLACVRACVRVCVAKFGIFCVFRQLQSNETYLIDWQYIQVTNFLFVSMDAFLGPVWALTSILYIVDFVAMVSCLATELFFSLHVHGLVHSVCQKYSTDAHWNQTFGNMRLWLVRGNF